MAFPAYCTPPQPMVEDAKPIDPRTVSEDKVMEWLERASRFEQALMVKQLSIQGWTYERAHQETLREWNKKRK